MSEQSEPNQGNAETQIVQNDNETQSVDSLMWEIGIIVVAAIIFLKWFKKKLDE